MFVYSLLVYAVTSRSNFMLSFTTRHNVFDQKIPDKWTTAFLDSSQAILNELAKGRNILVVFFCCFSFLRKEIKICRMEFHLKDYTNINGTAAKPSARRKGIWKGKANVIANLVQISIWKVCG